MQNQSITNQKANLPIFVRPTHPFYPHNHNNLSTKDHSPFRSIQALKIKTLHYNFVKKSRLKRYQTIEDEQQRKDENCYQYKVGSLRLLMKKRSESQSKVRCNNLLHLSQNNKNNNGKYLNQTEKRLLNGQARSNQFDDQFSKKHMQTKINNRYYQLLNQQNRQNKLGSHINTKKSLPQLHISLPQTLQQSSDHSNLLQKIKFKTIHSIEDQDHERGRVIHSNKYPKRKKQNKIKQLNKSMINKQSKVLLLRQKKSQKIFQPRQSTLAKLKFNRMKQLRIYNILQNKQKNINLPLSIDKIQIHNNNNNNKQLNINADIPNQKQKYKNSSNKEQYLKYLQSIQFNKDIKDKNNSKVKVLAAILGKLKEKKIENDLLINKEKYKQEHQFQIIDSKPVQPWTIAIEDRYK